MRLMVFEIFRNFLLYYKQMMLHQCCFIKILVGFKFH